MLRGLYKAYFTYKTDEEREEELQKEALEAFRRSKNICLPLSKMGDIPDMKDVTPVDRQRDCLISGTKK